VDIQEGKEYYLIDFGDRAPKTFAKVVVKGYVVNPYRGWTIRVIKIYFDDYDSFSDGQREVQSFPDRFFFDKERFNKLNSIYKHRFIKKCFGEVSRHRIR
jgi:hypothetical protein